MIRLVQLNSYERADFVRVVGPIFERSPWIAEGAWSMRPFAKREKLHQALCQVVQQAVPEKQLALIRAHPDLVGRAALSGSLSPASTREQASAGLDQLNPEETDLFRKQNAAYREKFGFPFVICARQNRKEAILRAFELRLKNSRREEIATALAEIAKIAQLRLEDLISG